MPTSTGATPTWCGWRPPESRSICWPASATCWPSTCLAAATRTWRLTTWNGSSAPLRNPLSLASLFERDAEALPILLQIFSTSQHFSDLLIRDPYAYDLLRTTEGQPATREVLVAELSGAVDGLDDAAAAMTVLRRFKLRETLRIAYGDLIRNQRLGMVTEQISFLADAIVEGALRFARRQLEQKRGRPLLADGRPARFVTLAMGKLGGVELNYSSDIDLVFLYEGDGKTDGPRPQTNVEFFERLAREIVKLLSETTDMGHAYRVDLRLRPEGERGPMTHSLEAAMSYYDVMGRTWERQAYVKARAIAGDFELGEQFLKHLEPWIYRRYLSLADITGIKALKRRIEHRVISEGDEQRNVKTGRGGIRDIEFSIQFLQLLNGGDLPEVRTGNTLEAIAQLENVGCLMRQERSLLEENYGFLRKIEHRLQIMFDLQTHLLPDDAVEMRKLAIRMGYADEPKRTALSAFESDYENKTAVNRKILDHLLHDAFGDDAGTEPEVDLVLDPAPPAERIAEVLGRYPFRDVHLAYQNLESLATEKLRFLLTRRCRHFLAAIAPRLLKAIAATPDPDSTLVNLEKVSDSLGGKGVLWELFSFNPPSMNLYVELCSSSPLLSGILTSHPGMIDELMDSLVLNKLPNAQVLRDTLGEMARAAEDLDPILHSFKNTMQLRVGVRDILGKEDVHATTAALSDIAQTCLEEIIRREHEKLAAKLGEPTIGEGPHAGEPCQLVVLALGKLGGRELNYQSDLDLVFIYEADGPTVFNKRARRGSPTNNQHFFSELGQRIVKTVSQLGPYGKLYQVDLRLRPTGRSGALATTFQEFARYFAEGDGQLWERQALCKARADPRQSRGRSRGVQARGDCRVRACLAARRRPGDQRHAAPHGRNRAAGQHQTRTGRDRRYRVPGADAAAQARPREPRPAKPQHAHGPGRAARSRSRQRRRLRLLQQELQLLAFGRVAAAVDELRQPGAARRPHRTGQAGPCPRLRRRRPLDRRVRQVPAPQPRTLQCVDRGGKPAIAVRGANCKSESEPLINADGR